MKIVKDGFCIMIVLLFIIACNQSDRSDIKEQENFLEMETLHIRHPYPNYIELFFGGGKGYEFKNDQSNKLIIYVGGSSYRASLGRNMTGDFIVDWLLAVLPLREKYSFFVLEKFNREIGKEYLNNIDERERYNTDNIANTYYAVISEYLSVNNYESIVLIGHSEGAVILPELYIRLNNSNITQLVSLAGGGGLTYYEQRVIFLEKLLNDDQIFSSLSESDRYVYLYASQNILRFYENEPYPDSPNLFLEDKDIGVTERWIAGIVHKNVFEFYNDINIPMLFLHGEMDIKVAVETTRYVQDNLPNKPFNYIYYHDMTHVPDSEKSAIMMNDIAHWILLNSK